MNQKDAQKLPASGTGDENQSSSREATPQLPQNAKTLSAADRLAGLADKIRQGVQETKQSLLVAVQNALPRVKGTGEYLLDAQAVCKGEGIAWEPWVPENCDMSLRTAQAYMRIAKNWEQIVEAQRSAPLSIDGALKLLAGPKKRAADAKNGRAGANDDAENEDGDDAAQLSRVNGDVEQGDAASKPFTGSAGPVEDESQENHTSGDEKDLTQKMEDILLAFDEAYGRFIVGLLQPIYPSLTYETVEWKEEAPEYVPETARQLAELVNAVRAARGVPAPHGK